MCAALICREPTALGSYDPADTSIPLIKTPYLSTRRWRQDWNSIDEPVSRNELHETPNDPEQEKERAAEPQRGVSFVAFLMPALSTCIPLDLAGDDWSTSNYHLGER